MTTREKLLAGGLIVAILTLGAAVFFGVLQVGPPTGDDEEEPPIIVENGSVILAPPYPDSSGNWGEWEQQGNGVVWHFKRPKTPANMRTKVYNGQCIGMPNNLLTGNVQFTYTDGTDSYTFEMLVTAGVTMLRTKAQEPVPVRGPNYRLTFEDPEGGRYWLQLLEPLGGSNTTRCTFGQTDRPIILVGRSGS
jgi:hypothetical protein